MTFSHTDLASAVELVRAAYEEAMQAAGMLRGKIVEVHSYADSLLDQLEREEEDGPER